MKLAFPMLGAVKHPYAVQRELVDWVIYKRELPAGTTLTAVTPQPPAGIAAVSGGVAGDVSTVIISGGTAGQRYPIALRSDWSNGDTDDRTLMVEVHAQVIVNPEPIELDPNADIFYGVDWSPLLAKIGGGVGISASAWPAVSGITIDTASIAGAVTQARFSAAAIGQDIVVENRIDLSNGDKDARNLRFRVRQL